MFSNQRGFKGHDWCRSFGGRIDSIFCEDCLLSYDLGEFDDTDQFLKYLDRSSPIPTCLEEKIRKIHDS